MGDYDCYYTSFGLEELIYTDKWSSISQRTHKRETVWFSSDKHQPEESKEIEKRKTFKPF